MINNLERNIKNFIGQDVEIIQNGFVENKYNLLGMKYFIEEDILNIIDEKSENYLKININQIYKVENNENSIKISMDNDLSIMISRIKSL